VPPQRNERGDRLFFFPISPPSSLTPAFSVQRLSFSREPPEHHSSSGIDRDLPLSHCFSSILDPATFFCVPRGTGPLDTGTPSAGGNSFVTSVDITREVLFSGDKTVVPFFPFPRLWPFSKRTPLCPLPAQDLVILRLTSPNVIFCFFFLSRSMPSFCHQPDKHCDAIRPLVPRVA